MRSEQKEKTAFGLKKSHMILLLALVIVAVAVWLFVWLGSRQQSEAAPETSVQESTVSETVSSEAAEAGDWEQTTDMATLPEELTFTLDQGLEITQVGSYTGAYVEDGSNDIVSDVLMITVTNTGDKNIQYAEITLTTDIGDASFSMSTLMPGETAVLLEQNRMTASEIGQCTGASASNIALFSETPGLCEDKIEISQLDGALNVTNISGEAISGEIIIYYKNYQSGLYYGGITYRVRISDGMEPGEIRQIMSDHFSTTGSKIVFVTCG